ncbi:MAG: RNA-splicing ligase RtcB [Candidatus Altiarchaeales archaeon ex4484_96]|nr:MAG: RNA-splicing ligase RtcB [Candidatus Altiarchaeales archaeon ex4484_96]
MDFTQIREGVWEHRSDGLNVPVRVYAKEKVFREMEEGVFKQASNVARLPGIEKASLVMPDGHYGYGFPIGGVAAFNLEDGVVSPGGVGYDINCGVRLLSSSLGEADVRPRLKKLVDALFDNIPCGVGRDSTLRLSLGELDDVSLAGARWAVEKGYGLDRDLQHIEEYGSIDGANPANVGKKAKSRGKSQLGTLGSGNHFLEVQRVDKIFDAVAAKKYGIEREGQVTVMVHCGSRGFGHQIADDYIKLMLSASAKYGIRLPDRELACAPLSSKEASDYLSAMYCAVNYAFANRQVITHWIRQTFNDVFRQDVDLSLTYDVCHNIAKYEKHRLSGKKQKLCIHRKGATRAFASGRKEIPEIYREFGQPVIIPGDMGTCSYLLAGTDKAMDETFGSTCHGAGRLMSRRKAIASFRGDKIQKELAKRGVFVKATHPKMLAEEASKAYKDVNEIIDSVELTGISKKIARFTPLGVAKG